MGRDKALLPFRGRALAAAIAQAVEKAAGHVTLVGNPALGAVTGYAAIADLHPGEGPLGGILTALRHTSADWNLIVGCDMPELTAPFLERLFEAAEASPAAILLPHGPSGLPEPLCAVYHRRALDAIEAAFNAGVRKLTAAFQGLEIQPYSVPEITPFQNVNTPQDWSVYAAE